MRVAAATLVAVAALAPAAIAAPPQPVGSMAVPGGDPASVGVHEASNKVFVSDDNSGNVLVFDGSSFQQIGTATGVGSSGYQTVVDQSLGRVYVASVHHPFTTGYIDGTGKIAVVDATTYSVTQVDVPGQNPSTSDFNLLVDEGRDRVWVAHSGGIGFIDAANAFTPVPGAPATGSSYDIGINTATNEVYYPAVGNRIAIVDGDTLGITYFDYAAVGANAPLDFAVGEQDNKLYVTFVFVPGQAEPGIMILDRDTGVHSFVGRSDLNPIVFNPLTNRLLAGVQVGTDAGLVDGATDAFTEVTLPDGGVGAMGVMRASDNAFMSTQQATYVMNGSLRCAQRFASEAPLRGGVVAAEVALNQATGRAFVVNDQEQAKVTVFQDGQVECPAPEPAPGGGGTPPLPPFPPPGGATQDDFTAPPLVVAAARVQRITARGLALRVGCAQEPCLLSARGTVSVPGGARVYRFRTVRASLDAGERRVLRLRLARKPLAAVRRALRRRKRLVARVTVAAEDIFGNRRSVVRRIRLRR